MDFLGTDAEKQNEEERKEADRIAKRKISDLRKLLKQPEFRRFAWELLGETGIFKASFSQNSMTTCFNEGRRDIGLAFLNNINEANTNAYAQMQQEYVSELKSKDTKNKNKEE